MVLAKVLARDVNCVPMPLVHYFTADMGWLDWRCHMLTKVLFIAISGLVAVAAGIVFQLPLAVGTGVFVGLLAEAVYEARRQQKPVEWVSALATALAAAATAFVVLWILEE